MKHRFLFHWVIAVVLCLLTLAFPLAQSNASARAAATLHADMARMKKAVTPTSASWRVVPSPNRGEYSTLDKVAAISASDVWAVGSGVFTAASHIPQTLIEHWNGTSWQVVPSFAKKGSELLGVAAVSASDVWAVGDYNNQTDSKTLIEQWNGTSWNVVPSPNPGDSQDNTLDGVAAVSASDVWAVGLYINTKSGFQTLIEHWDGTSWSIVPSLNPSTTGNTLWGVAAASASDVWAVGYYYNGDFTQTLIEQWNGTSWQVVPSPNPGGTNNNYLLGVAAVSASDVWAVGHYDTANAYPTLIEHWDGTSWNVVPSPGPGKGDNALGGVAVVSASDVWAIGGYNNAPGNDVPQTLTEHWNGTSWNVVPSPNPSQQANDLYAVAVVSMTDVWAVGDYGDLSDRSTLTEQYSS